MRASIAAETAGIPSVSIVCKGFEGQASATARGHGFDGLPLAVTTSHVDTQSHDEMVADFVASTVDQIIDALTMSDVEDDGSGDPAGTTRSEPAAIDTGRREPAASDTGRSEPAASDTGRREPAAIETVATGTIDGLTELFAARGWSDGLPIVPPTRERVEAFLAPGGHDPWLVLGTAASSGRDLTVWSVAVNAVMAGCRPEQLPVLLAVAEILADPAYGMEHSGNTTGADALMILDGPIVQDLGFNHGPGAMRDGSPANTAVGRWLRLYLRNVGGFTADEHDKATFGNTFRVVLAEDMAAIDEIGWEPVSARFGHGPDDDVVTMARMNSGLIIGSVVGSTPEAIVPYLGDGLARVAGWDLTHNHGLGQDQFRPLLVLSPILARTVARAGWSTRDLQEALFDAATIPAARYESLIGAWSNLTPGRRLLTDLVGDGHLPDAFARSRDPERPVPVVTDPANIVIAVAGDPNRTNAYVLSNDGPHGDWTARAIDREPSLDLVCRVPEPGEGAG
ncbi:MAG: UGSC family (seleno)protein [Actinomycetota bacterium]